MLGKPRIPIFFRSLHLGFFIPIDLAVGFALVLALGFAFGLAVSLALLLSLGFAFGLALLLAVFVTLVLSLGFALGFALGLPLLLALGHSGVFASSTTPAPTVRLLHAPTHLFSRHNRPQRLDPRAHRLLDYRRRRRRLSRKNMESYSYTLDLCDRDDPVRCVSHKPNMTLHEFRLMLGRPAGVDVDKHGGKHYLRVCVRKNAEFEEVVDLNQQIDFTNKPTVKAVWVRVL